MKKLIFLLIALCAVSCSKDPIVEPESTLLCINSVAGKSIMFSGYELVLLPDGTVEMHGFPTWATLVWSYDGTTVTITSLDTGECVHFTPDFGMFLKTDVSEFNYKHGVPGSLINSEYYMCFTEGSKPRWCD